MRGMGIGLLLVAACFQPQPPSGAPCPDNRVCPDGFDCIGGFCIAPGPHDAAIDTQVDGSAGVDTDSDGVDDVTDNCRVVQNADQRDWDADTRGDACDGCPHLASATETDGDGDGVGDACDPRPMLGGDARLRWYGFYDASEIAGWQVGAGMWAVTGGALVQSTVMDYAFIAPPDTYQRIYVGTSFDLTARIAQAAVAECAGDVQATNCCSVEDLGMIVAETQSGMAVSTKAWPGTFAVGSRVDIAQTITGMHACRFTQGATAVTDATQSASGSGPIVFATAGAAVRFRYLFVVQIGS